MKNLLDIPQIFSTAPAIKLVGSMFKSEEEDEFNSEAFTDKVSQVDKTKLLIIFVDNICSNVGLYFEESADMKKHAADGNPEQVANTLQKIIGRPEQAKDEKGQRELLAIIGLTAKDYYNHSKTEQKKLVFRGVLCALSAYFLISKALSIVSSVVRSVVVVTVFGLAAYASDRKQTLENVQSFSELISSKVSALSSGVLTRAGSDIATHLMSVINVSISSMREEYQQTQKDVENAEIFLNLAAEASDGPKNPTVRKKI